MAEPLLQVRHLRVEFPTRRGTLLALDDISFDIFPGEVLGVVGESGAGKSLTGAAIIGLLEPPGRVAGGEILLEGRRIDNLPHDEMRAIRGRKIGAIFQDPLTSLNPLYTIGRQLTETIQTHLSVGAEEARARAIRLLQETGIPAAEQRIDQYPHQFSGGMRQRVVIALALGSVAIPPLFRFVERVRVSGTLSTVALGFALALALLATQAGSAMIIGAFAAGLILHPTPQRHEIEESATHLGFFFVPIFFATVGASIDLAALMTREALVLGGLLVLVGVTGKVLAGFAPWWFKGNKLLIGVALVPRGEVGLIFAQLGLAAGVLTNERFGALMLMVIVTTFLTPPLLSLIATRGTPDEASAPDHVGIDDLVVGASQRRSKHMKPLHKTEG